MKTKRTMCALAVLGLLIVPLAAHARSGSQNARGLPFTPRTKVAPQRGSLLHAPWGTNVKVSDASALGPGQSAVAVGPGSDVYAVWSDSRAGYGAVFFSRSTDKGTSWGPNGRVDLWPAPQAYPDIAVDNAGNIHVTWADGRSGPTLQYLDIYYARSTDGGASWSNHRRINDDAGVAAQTWPAIAADSTGTIHIVWHDMRNGNGDIYFARSTDSGVSWGPNQRIDDGPGSSSQERPDIAVSGFNRLCAVWADGRNGNADIYASQSANGGASWSAAVKVNDDVGTKAQGSPAVAADGAGNVYAVWTDLRNEATHYEDIYFARSRDGGVTWHTNERVVDASGASGVQTSPAIALDGFGRLYAAWTDRRNYPGDPYDVYSAQSLDGGMTWSTNERVNDDATGNNNSYPAIAVDPVGNAYAVWQDSRSPSGIYSARRAGQYFNLSASPPSRSITPGGSTTYAVSLAAEGGFNKAVTLSVADLPAGATAAFSANPVTPPGSSTLTVNTTAAIPVAIHPLAIRGVDGSVTRQTVVNLEVTCGTTGPAVTQVTASLDGKAGDDIGTFISLPGRAVPVMNTFTAQVTPAVCPVQRVAFTLAGQTVTDSNGADGWNAQFDMSELPAGANALQVQAYDQVNPGQIRTINVHVFATPAYVGASWVLNPRVSWSAAEQKYTFSGTVPHNPDFGFVKPFNIRYLGTLHNVFASQVNIVETFAISGQWQASASGALNATLLNRPLANLTYGVAPHLNGKAGGGGVAWYEVPVASFTLSQQRVPVYSGVVFTLAGVFNLSMSIDLGYEVTLRIWGTINSDWSVAEMRLMPDVAGLLGFTANACIFGVACVGASATPRLGIGLPVVYRDDPPPGGGSVYLDTACTHFDITDIRVSASLGWGWLRKTWSWGPYTCCCWDDPSYCYCPRPQASLALDDAESSEPDLFAAPWLANNGAGQIMAVWMQDQDPDPSNVDPEVVYAVWDGATWSTSQLLTRNDRWESDPRLAFLAPDDALAVWTQNELTQEQTSEDTSLNDVLSNQELYYARWNGMTWSTPARLTHDTLPDGRAALAADPLHGKALLAWVHDGDGSPETKGDWDLYYAAWDGSGWSAPSALITDTAVAEAEVSVRYDSQGNAMAIWVEDHDADLNTNADRRAAYAVWDGQAWTTPLEPQTWPTGALNPSVAFDSADRPIVVLTSRGTLESGEDAGIGNHDYLWSAYRRDGEWDVQPIGTETAAEWPRVVVNADDQAILVFRQFGEAGTIHFIGEVAGAVADLTQPTLEWGPPDFLTEEGGLNWQIAFDFDPTTGTTQILYVRGTPASAGSKARAMGNGSDQVYGLSLPYDPDLQIRPADIAFSNEHPLAGETILITATVRNKGFQEVGGPVGIHFFRGDPDAGGTLIGQSTTGYSLAFGESSAVTATWAVVGGRHDIYVLVDPTQETSDFDRVNNKASCPVGAVPPPTSLVAATYAANHSILLTWTAPETGGIAGYYVYRSTTPGSGYSLIADVSATSYEDPGLPDHVVYYYVVAAYDDYGVVSAYGDEASASLPGLETPTPTPTPTATPTRTPTPTPTPTSTPVRIWLPVIVKGWSL